MVAGSDQGLSSHPVHLVHPVEKEFKVEDWRLNAPVSGEFKGPDPASSHPVHLVHPVRAFLSGFHPVPTLILSMQPQTLSINTCPFGWRRIST